MRNPSSSPAITPLTIFGSSLKLWLRADLGITIGTGVSAWADQSGNSNNYTQGTGANQPSFNASDINGKPSVQFDGVNDQLDSALDVAVATPSAGFLIFAVMRNDVGTAATGVYFTNKPVWMDPVGGNMGFGFGNDFLQPGFWQPGELHVSAALTTATWAQAYFRYDGATMAASWNKGAEAAAAATYSGAIAGASSMGKSNAATFFAGRVAELVIVNRSASAAERSTLQAYATTRYGV